MTMTNEPETPTLTKAIAIKGSDNDASSMHGAPKIIAKGSGAMAEKILDIAFAEGVKVRQDKDLTEVLDAFELESPIPLEALHTVSLILKRVYAENQKMAEYSSGKTQSEDTVDAPTQAPPQPTVDGATGTVIRANESQEETDNG
jgi:flagellar biosynthesis protein